MSAVNRLCERSLLLDNGCLRYLGSSEQAVRQYLEYGLPDTAARIDLRHAVRERHNPQKIITWMSVHRRDGTAATEFATGDDVVLRIGYEMAKPLPSVCEINCLNHLGDVVMNIKSTHSVDSLSLSGSGCIECVLRDIRLLSGEYVLMVSIGRALPAEEWLDHVPRAIRLRVQTGGYLGGADWRHGPHGAVAQKSEWRVDAPTAVQCELRGSGQSGTGGVMANSS
jgi:hypothetical protein